MDDNLIFPDDSRPTRSDAVKNHALLLETAQQLFDSQGLDNVSMSAIAEAAGVGKGTLYRHFKNKSDLAHALLDQEMRDLQERSLRRFNNQGDPLDNLGWFLEQILRFVDRNQALLCIAAEHDLTAVLSSPAHGWWRQTIHAFLSRIPTVRDVDYMTDVLYVMVDVRTIYFQKLTLGYDTTRILAGLHTVLEHLTS
jgi:AcrR family transcriptional regulator